MLYISCYHVLRRNQIITTRQNFHKSLHPSFLGHQVIRGYGFNDVRKSSIKIDRKCSYIFMFRKINQHYTWWNLCVAHVAVCFVPKITALPSSLPGIIVKRKCNNSKSNDSVGSQIASFYLIFRFTFPTYVQHSCFILISCVLVPVEILYMLRVP